MILLSLTSNVTPIMQNCKVALLDIAILTNADLMEVIKKIFSE